MRLQKYMADAGIASRRKCEEYINAGLVKVNGVIATIGTVVTESDTVEYNGETLKPEQKRVVIMLNKPNGVLCTNSDPQGRRTTAEFFTELPYRLYNIGRLDYNSEGLVLFTNDGDLAYKLMHPSFMIDKTYKVLCAGKLTKEEKAKLVGGVMLDDGMTAPAEVFDDVYFDDNDRTALYITIHEGRNRQVRRMLDAVGHRVLRLRRVAEGGLRLSGLRAGEWRYLTQTEIDGLLKK